MVHGKSRYVEDLEVRIIMKKKLQCMTFLCCLVSILPASVKGDKRLHGLGIGNIQKCAKKYRGDIDITIHNTGDRKKFNLAIMKYKK